MIRWTETAILYYNEDKRVASLSSHRGQATRPHSSILYYIPLLRARYRSDGWRDCAPPSCARGRSFGLDRYVRGRLISAAYGRFGARAMPWMRAPLGSEGRGSRRPNGRLRRGGEGSRIDEQARGLSYQIFGRSRNFWLIIYQKIGSYQILSWKMCGDRRVAALSINDHLSNRESDS